MKIASNTGAAKAAVSGFSGIEVDSTGQQATLGSSNVAGMKAGAKVANKMLSEIAELVSSVKSQADGVTALATEIADRDKRDGAAFK